MNLIELNTDSLYFQVWQKHVGGKTAYESPILVAAFLVKREAERHCQSLNCTEWLYEVRDRRAQ